MLASERAVVERLTGIGRKVETIIGGLARAAEGARGQVDGVGTAFHVQAGALGKSVDEAYRRIEGYGQAFRDQAANLVDASEAAEARAQARIARSTNAATSSCARPPT